MPTLGELTRYLDRFAPPSSAAEWDNVGLLLGDAAFLLERVMTCLTVTPDVVEEAVREKAQLIVSHHPILFRAAKKITAQTPDGKLILPLARAGVAVYSPHTAFDNCPGGINDILCRRLGMTAVRPLRDREAPPQYKLVVFVPDADLSNVSDAVFAAGGGVIGQYRECSYRLQGTGTFFGTDSTNPTVGQKGRREEVAEWRLEVVVPQQALSTVLTAMRKAHSYEEPAFDVYPLKAGFSGGEGRLGELNEALLLGQFVDRVKTSLGAKAVHYVGDANRPVRRVALACGAAGEFLSDSMRANADVFLTGELRFHDALTARTNGIGVVLPGHYATERPAIEELAKKIAGDWPGLRIWPSRVECDPLTSSDA